MRQLENSNPIRLSWREWAAAVMLCLAALSLLPARWPAVGRHLFAHDYRLPSELSSDYWMFRAWAEHSRARDSVAVLGDSVVWGQYVRNDETLSHHLNALAGHSVFANLGVDGLHPAALEGMIAYYGGALHDQPVLVHLNPLWMTSPEQDLRGKGDARFNHPKLVPQVLSRPAAYHPSPPDVAAAVLERHVPFLSWREHLKAAYYDGLALPDWSIDNPYRLLAADRGPDAFSSEDPGSPPESWQQRGIAVQDLPWVEASQSYQWHAFQRALRLLRTRGNRVFVLLGPFNTHALTPASQARYHALQETMAQWLAQQKIPYLAPPVLPTDLYADASHPLAAGYRRIAEELYASPSFRDWQRSVAGAPHKAGPSGGLMLFDEWIGERLLLRVGQPLGCLGDRYRPSGRAPLKALLIRFVKEPQPATQPEISGPGAPERKDSQ